ncbi:MAG: short-chain dehydrogenase [Vulcanimicrobiota bacterium]
MNIKGSTVLVLGGAGMVGRAVCRELIENEPARIIVSSLFEAEAREAVEQLQEEYQRARGLQGIKGVEFIPEWGNIFTRTSLKDKTGGAIVSDPEGRQAVIEDTLAPLTFETLKRFFLYELVMRHKPQVIIDGINTATGIAYSDIFTRARKVWQTLQHEGPNRDEVEHLLCSLYIPQLIRHVDVLYRSMARADTQAYVKLGTSGTGGMGWNIPYTHGEERPSALLLSKSAVAGAHTLLLFLLARTPGILTFQDDDPHNLLSKPAPATMEIKPTALIGWRGIRYGDVIKRGRPVQLEAISLADAKPIGSEGDLTLYDARAAQPTDEVMRTVFVDTGENGLFSTEEFIAITSPGQMEFVTPEEIARNVVDEVRGINTGKDVINALNVTCMGPTYRAGFQRERAIQKLRQLEREHGVESIAFENLGPPRLSKLLYEAAFLRRIYGTIQKAVEATPADMTARCLELLREHPKLVATPATIGIPILFEEDGVRQLVRGREVKTPPSRGDEVVPLDDVSVEQWVRAGWIDLRVENMAVWKQRFEKVRTDAASIPAADTSSRYVRDLDFWEGENDAWPINPGELVAWIFINEDKGERGRE